MQIKNGDARVCGDDAVVLAVRCHIILLFP